MDCIGNLHNDQHPRAFADLDGLGDVNQHPNIHTVRLGSADGDPNLDANYEVDGIRHFKFVADLDGYSNVVHHGCARDPVTNRDRK